MFPLKTLPNARKKPHLTRLLVLLNVVIFGVQWFLWLTRGVDLASVYGVVPHCFTVPTSCGISSLHASQPLWVSLVAALFLHGDVLHLAFNMLFLSVFGGGLEDKIGRLRFALIYFGGGLVASAAHIAFHPFSTAATIGASGAIAAVLGAYLVALPKSWVLTYLPPVFLFPTPAPLFLVVWIVGQIYGAVGDFGWGAASRQNDIAWMAHLGGFAFGAFWGWKIAPWVKNAASVKNRGAR